MMRSIVSNRCVIHVMWKNNRKLLRPIYNQAGSLQRVLLNETVYVAHIAYNAKGQRSLVAYGNNVMTRYAYDIDSFRLVRMRSERFRSNDPFIFTPSSSSNPLQEFAYQYDLAGNIFKNSGPCTRMWFTRPSQ